MRWNLSWLCLTHVTQEQTKASLVEIALKGKEGEAEQTWKGKGGGALLVTHGEACNSWGIEIKSGIFCLLACFCLSVFLGGWGTCLIHAGLVFYKGEHLEVLPVALKISLKKKERQIWNKYVQEQFFMTLPCCQPPSFSPPPWQTATQNSWSLKTYH